MKSLTDGNNGNPVDVCSLEKKVFGLMKYLNAILIAKKEEDTFHRNLCRLTKTAFTPSLSIPSKKSTVLHVRDSCVSGRKRRADRTAAAAMCNAQAQNITTTSSCLNAPTTALVPPHFGLGRKRKSSLPQSASDMLIKWYVRCLFISHNFKS